MARQYQILFWNNCFYDHLLFYGVSKSMISWTDFTLVLNNSRITLCKAVSECHLHLRHFVIMAPGNICNLMALHLVSYAGFLFWLVNYFNYIDMHLHFLSYLEIWILQIVESPMVNKPIIIFYSQRHFCSLPGNLAIQTYRIWISKIFPIYLGVLRLQRQQGITTIFK